MDIFIVDVTGSQIRQLTHGEGTNEDPSWSPDGRYISFSTTRNGSRQIYVMDSDGSAQHALARVPGNSYTPSWSP
jgi:TolB protein